MKTLFTILGALAPFLLYSQATGEPYDFNTTQPIRVYDYNFAGATAVAPASVKTAYRGLTFEQIGGVVHDVNLGDIYIIKFRPIVAATDIFISDPTAINSTNTQANEFYCIKVSDFITSNIRKRYKTWRYNNKPSVGALFLQVKMRPRKAGVPLDFTQDFTLGPTLGWSFRATKYKATYLSPVISLGLTSVTVDSITTRGNFEQPTKLAAYTFGFGVIYEVEYFQIAALVGWDYLGGLSSKNWIYNGRNWFSLGIGVQLWKAKE